MAQPTNGRLALIVVAVSILSACASSPSARFNSKAEAMGFTKKVISTPQFDLTVFYNNVTKTEGLNIYIEGDGRPFIHKTYINQDPTSTQALTLKLMSQDPTRSVLVGRPCYHKPKARNCNDSKWWTSHRYSKTIVESIVNAINNINTPKDDVTLIGFSGGGTLAMLAAGHLRTVKRVITINANLDINAWATQHNYTQLSGSLNPIDFLDDLSSIPQDHLIGGKDTNVDASVWRSKLEPYDSVIVHSYPDFNHQCCWEKIWGAFLKKSLPVSEPKHD